MDIQKQRSQVQENLLTLYLRLNGYFVTGFIVHSSIHGRVITEVDVLAVRFPHSAEPERQIGPDPFVETSDELTDFVICEVKSRGQQLRFNESLLGSTAAIKTVLRWAGLFEEPELKTLAPDLQMVLTPSTPPRTGIPTVICRQSRVRGILCSPERAHRRSNQPWFVPGDAILKYVWDCLCPKTPRPDCATVYDFGLWNHHEPIVRYFKERADCGPGTIKELYKFLGLHKS